MISSDFLFSSFIYYIAYEDGGHHTFIYNKFIDIFSRKEEQNKPRAFMSTSSMHNEPRPHV